MFANYRNTSVASFGSTDSANYDPSLSTHSLAWTSTQLGGSFSGNLNSNSDTWNSNPPPSTDVFPKRSLNGIVTAHAFTPPHGEPKTRITVTIAFKQLPGRVVGLRIVLGGIAMKTQVAQSGKRGQWLLRTEIPSDYPISSSPASQMIRIEALEMEVVIDSLDVGNFSVWQTGGYTDRSVGLFA